MINLNRLANGVKSKLLSMETKMEKSNEMGRDYDDSAEKAGQEFIRKNWNRLKPRTTETLISSGYYDNHGNRDQEHFGGGEVEHLEFNVGLLDRCDHCSLPNRSDNGAHISKDVYSDDIFGACVDLLYQPLWHDPQFLRLALNAFPKHQMANLLFILPPIKEDKPLFLFIKFLAIVGFGFLLFLITISSPYFLGLAFVSAAQGDIESTVFALYVLGSGVWIHFFMKNMTNNESKKSQYEKNYDAWNGLRSHWGWQSTGSGARFCFHEMAKNGVSVPPLAFDLCAALEASILKRY